MIVYSYITVCTLCVTVECQKKKPGLGSDNKNIPSRRVNDDDLAFPTVNSPCGFHAVLLFNLARKKACIQSTAAR